MNEKQNYHYEPVNEMNTLKDTYGEYPTTTLTN